MSFDETATSVQASYSTTGSGWFGMSGTKKLGTKKLAAKYLMKHKAALAKRTAASIKKVVVSSDIDGHQSGRDEDAFGKVSSPAEGTAVNKVAVSSPKSEKGISRSPNRSPKSVGSPKSEGGNRKLFSNSPIGSPLRERGNGKLFGHSPVSSPQSARGSGKLKRQGSENERRRRLSSRRNLDKSTEMLRAMHKSSKLSFNIIERIDSAAAADALARRENDDENAELGLIDIVSPKNNTVCQNENDLQEIVGSEYMKDNRKVDEDDDEGTSDALAKTNFAYRKEDCSDTNCNK
jgi:hypothetical protein